MSHPDGIIGNYILKERMTRDEYLKALEKPDGYLVGGPSVTYITGVGYNYTQLFEKFQDESKSAGGTRHRRKRNKKTRKAF